MKKFFSVIAFFFKSFYVFPEIRDQNKKISVKSIAKIIGIILLAVYVLGSFGFLAWKVYYSIYKIFASVGIQKLLILYALVYGSIITVIFCIVSVISTIYSNDMEAYITTLPIRTSHVISAKAGTIAFAQLWITLFVIGSGLGIYWYFEKAPFLMLVNAIIFVIIITIIATALGYIIGLPLLSMSKLFRNRDRVMIITGALVFVFILYFNATTNKIMSLADSPQVLMQMFEGGNQSFLSLYGKSSIIKFILTIFLEAQNPLYTGLLVLLLLGVLGINYNIFKLLSPLYRYVIRNFSESYVKKLNKNQTSELLGKYAQKSSALKALVLREMRLMNREPVYFMNGPFIIVLMPLILGISMYFNISNDSRMKEFSDLSSAISPVIKVLIVSLFGAFLGSATSITCTSISRDAKHLAFMKSLPVSITSYLGAKLIHGCTFGFLGNAMSLILGVVILKLQVAEILLAVAISISLTVILNTVGLIVDTVNPRLNWESPIAALKQNINAAIVILGEMLLIGLLGYIGFTKITSLMKLGFFLGLLPAIGAAVLIFFYFSFAEKRISKLDV